jgi:hypothetical protein
VNVYPFIEAEKVCRRNVKRACELLKVSRAAFYQHLAGKPSQREASDTDLTAQIRAVHQDSKGRYGAPRIHAELRHGGHRHGRKRIARLMRRAGLAGRAARRWRKTPVVAASDGEARRHPLHVVLERPRQRLVEVVQIEQQPPFGRGEQPEIRQMGIPAQLRVQASHRRVRQIRRHDLGCAPVERERRDHHPAMTDRHQIQLAGAVLLLQETDWVRAVRGRAPLRVARYRRPIPGLQALGPAFVDARMRSPSYGHPAHHPF